MSKLLKQIVTDGTKKKSGQNKTIRITLDIEYYEKIKLFCERYNRNLNGTIIDVLEEFVDEIEKSDPLYNTMINTQEGSGIVSLTDHKKKKVERVILCTC